MIFDYNILVMDWEAGCEKSLKGIICGDDHADAGQRILYLLEDEFKGAGKSISSLIINNPRMYEKHN